MIYELTVRNPKRTTIPHWSEVAFLRRLETLQFQPGLNVIFGPNGSGKSTLINALAMLLHCKAENWPRVTKQSLMLFNRPVGLCDGLLLEHDGSPARYLGIDEDLAFAPEAHVEKKKVILSADVGNKPLDRMSAGQATMTKLIRFLRSSPKKVRYSITRKTAVGEWRSVFDIGTESLKNVTSRPAMPRQPVLLLDEPDRSMDIAKQAAVWKQLRMLATDHQVIVASHSVFALTVPAANYIETVDGYLADSRRALPMLAQAADPMPAAPAITQAA